MSGLPGSPSRDAELPPLSGSASDVGQAGQTGLTVRAGRTECGIRKHLPVEECPALFAACYLKTGHESMHVALYVRPDGRTRFLHWPDL